MSMSLVRTILRGQLSGPLSLEHLKSPLTLDVVAGNTSKRPESGMGEAVAIPERSAG